jgi:hypothetical protein
MNMRVITTQTTTIDTVQSVPIISLLESGNVTLVNLVVLCETKEYFLKYVVRRM